MWGGKNTPEENVQYLMSPTSDFNVISVMSSQMNLAYNPVEIFELNIGWPYEWRSSQGHTWEFMTIFTLFKDKESIFDIITKLPCSGDLDNPVQLPVQ